MRRFRVDAIVLILVVALLASCGFRRRKYENPITKDTQQPDKVLFDKAIKDIERGRYEVARLTLQTLINTYDTSEFLAKSKLALADSYYREGGSHGLAQAEAEYKDFKLFYPMLEEAAEAQEKVCTIHYKQMEKADRDITQAMRTDEECRAVLVEFPNSKFAPQAQQMLRNVQEVLAEAEYRVGAFYYAKGSLPAAANRLQTLTDHYPLFSKADDSLWKLGDTYGRMGPRLRDRSAAAYAKIVRDYPLSPLVDSAKKRLQAMEQPIPESDPVAVARMKYELENLDTPGMMSHFWGIFRKSPDVTFAAKSGTPSMETLRPSAPMSVPPPQPPPGLEGSTADVTATTVTGPSALDTKPDARQNQDTEAKASDPASDQSATTPTNHPGQKNKKDKKKKKG
jgi:outer membrane protein assembly factor BamD